MAIKKIYYTWKDTEHMCNQLINQLYKDEWKPDYIVGITRGGNVPATILSNITGIRCEALKVALRDGESGKSGDSIEWMAEDALKGKKILYCLTLDPFGLDKNDFWNWKGISIEPIPQKILDIYGSIYEY